MKVLRKGQLRWSRGFCFAVIFWPLWGAGCMSAYKKSLGGSAEQVFTKTFLTDYAFVWEAALESLKTSPMELVNRESGALQTKWIDNTAERNLIDSAGSINPYIKAQYRFRVMISKGIYEGQNSVRISVQKEQQYQRDVLEGWRNQETDSIQENSLLYRIGKLVEIKSRIQRMEDQKLKEQMRQAAPQVEPPITSPAENPLEVIPEVIPETAPETILEPGLTPLPEPTPELILDAPREPTPRPQVKPKPPRKRTKPRPKPTPAVDEVSPTDVVL